MKITGNTNLADIVKSFQGVNEEKNLRLHESGNEKTLKIHDGLLPSGWGDKATEKRGLKHKAAVNLIKNVVSAQFSNNPKIADKLFEKLGIKNELSVGTLKKLHLEVEQLRVVESNRRHEEKIKLGKEVDMMGRQMHGWVKEVEKRVLSQMDDLPPVNPKKMASPSDDKFRTKVLNEDKKDAMVKASENGVESLNLKEAVGCLKSIYENTPVMRLDKVVALMNHESVSVAVGVFTGKNGLGSKKEVGGDFSSGMMKHSAAQLRDVIKESLTPLEIQDLKKRIDFLNELAPKCLDHFGKTHANSSREDELKYWAKSVAVSFSLFVGHKQESVVEMDKTNVKEASVKARDLITVLAIHSNIIFGNEQVDQLAFLDGPGGNNNHDNGRFVPLMNF